MSRERTDAVAREDLDRRPARRPDEALSAQARLMLSLQRRAGNRAVSDVVQRMRSEEAEPAGARGTE